MLQNTYQTDQLFVKLHPSSHTWGNIYAFRASCKISRNTTYTSMTECTNSKGEGTKKRKNTSGDTAKVNLCLYCNYGCYGGKKQKTNHSQHCTFFQLERLIIIKNMNCMKKFTMIILKYSFSHN